MYFRMESELIMEGEEGNEEVSLNGISMIDKYAD